MAWWLIWLCAVMVAGMWVVIALQIVRNRREQRKRVERMRAMQAQVDRLYKVPPGAGWYGGAERAQWLGGNRRHDPVRAQRSKDEDAALRRAAPAPDSTSFYPGVGFDPAPFGVPPPPMVGGGGTFDGGGASASWDAAPAKLDADVPEGSFGSSSSNDSSSSSSGGGDSGSCSPSTDP